MISRILSEIAVKAIFPPWGVPRANASAKFLACFVEMVGGRGGSWGSTTASTITGPGDCHHQAILKTGAEGNLLRRTGLKPDVLDAGCCGMAGDYGFRNERPCRGAPYWRAGISAAHAHRRNGDHRRL